MSITVIIELQIKPTKLEAVRSLSTAFLRETRVREGNESVTVHQDTDCPATIILVEKWRSKKLYESYTRWRAEKGDYERLSGLLGTPLIRRFFDQVKV